MGKHTKSNKKKKVVLVILIIIAILGVLYLGKYLYKTKKSKDLLNSVKIDLTQVTDVKTEKILKVEELKKQNNDIVGWLEIEGTSISYPVLQTNNNDFYIDHDYTKEYNKQGALFLDKDYDWNLPSTNLLIYGHNNRDGSGMFHQLLEYKNENFYKEHPTIKFTSTSEESEYEIIAVFESKVYYKSEKDVFRYYYFINAENEKEFKNYVENSKKASLYDTGKTATYGDELITLSACAYHTEDGRFAIVAKKVIE